MSVKCNCFSIADKNDLWFDHVKNNVFELIENKSEDYVEKAILKCKSCNKIWHFEQNDSYHYPIVSWTSKG